MEDQDTLEKVDQGSKMHFMFFQVSHHLCTQITIHEHYFFFTSSTPLSLTQNVDLFVNYHVFLVHGWICLIVANFGKEKKNPQFFFPMSQCQNDFMVVNWLP